MYNIYNTYKSYNTCSPFGTYMTYIYIRESPSWSRDFDRWIRNQSKATFCVWSQFGLTLAAACGPALMLPMPASFWYSATILFRWSWEDTWPKWIQCASLSTRRFPSVRWGRNNRVQRFWVELEGLHKWWHWSAEKGLYNLRTFAVSVLVVHQWWWWQWLIICWELIGY